AFEYTITNSTGTMILGGDPNGGYGGSMALGGTWRALTASGATLFTLPLSAIGVNGTATVAHAYGGNVTIFGTGWGTAPATLTGIDTAFGGSATVSVQATGSDLRTPGGLGAIQFVTPVKIVTPFGAMGMILGLDVMVVPEPGGACLIGAGLVGLLGLRRSRDRGPAPR
ncbi:MAG TPA: hypothetical protein VKB65_01005, partial [Myxococcota bacterium]|nr:hypothetical protein [Myxococcota bacterium]